MRNIKTLAAAAGAWWLLGHGCIMHVNIDMLYVHMYDMKHELFELLTVVVSHHAMSIPVPGIFYK